MDGNDGIGSVRWNDGMGGAGAYDGMRGVRGSDHRAVDTRAAAHHVFACHHDPVRVRCDRSHHPDILQADAYASPWLGSTVPTSLLVMRPFASFQIWRR